MKDPDFWPRFVNDHALGMLSCHDVEGVYLHVTPSCQRLLGYRPEELIGHSAYEFFHPEDLETIQASHRQIHVEPGTTIRAIYRIRRRDGSYTWFETVSCELTGAGETGQPVIYASSQDVSDRVAFDLAKARLSEVLQDANAASTADWQSMLTMCAWTGKVNYEGNWMRIEEFLWRRFGIQVSHGMAPEVPARLFKGRSIESRDAR